MRATATMGHRLGAPDAHVSWTPDRRASPALPRREQQLGDVAQLEEHLLCKHCSRNAVLTCGFPGFP